MQTKGFLFFLLFFLFSCNNHSKQEAFPNQKQIFSNQEEKIKVEILYDKTDIALWQTWRIQFIFQHPATYQFREKYLSILDYYPLSLKTDPFEETIFDPKNNLWKKSFLYILEAPAAGNFTLQQKTFLFKNLENSKKALLTTPQISINVSTSITQDSEFQKTDELITKESKVIYYLLALGLVLLLLAIYFWRKKASPEKEVFLITKWALKELKKLKRKNLISSQEIKHYHFELSRILRIFFEKQFSMRATTKTREEFLQDLLKQKNFQNNYRKLLEHYLEINDRVKFASYRASEEHNEEIFELVTKIITSYHQEQK